MADDDRRLTTYVTVHRGEKGEAVSTTFGPGVPIPEWAAKQITNPDVWEDGEDAGRPASAAPQLVRRGDATDEGPYGSWTVDKLRDEISDRNKRLQDGATPISSRGRKVDLIARLIAHDASGSAGMDGGGPGDGDSGGGGDGGDEEE